MILVACSLLQLQPFILLFVTAIIGLMLFLKPSSNYRRCHARSSFYRLVVRPRFWPIRPHSSRALPPIRTYSTRPCPLSGTNLCEEKVICYTHLYMKDEAKRQIAREKHAARKDRDLYHLRDCSDPRRLYLHQEHPAAVR